MKRILAAVLALCISVSVFAFSIPPLTIEQKLAMGFSSETDKWWENKWVQTGMAATGLIIALACSFSAGSYVTAHSSNNKLRERRAAHEACTTEVVNLQNGYDELDTLYRGAVNLLDFHTDLGYARKDFINAYFHGRN
jgi:hypothetical protein